MIRKITALIFTILLCLSFSACSKADTNVPKGMKLASNEITDYILYVPQDWTVDMSTGVTSAYFSPTDPSNISVIISSLSSANMTASEYWGSYKEQYTQTLSDMEELETSNIILGGINAETHVFTATMSGTKYKFKQAIAVKGTDAYIFTYTATENNYDTHIDDVDSILEHFQFS